MANEDSSSKGTGDNTPARNDAEREASRQSWSEEAQTGKSAVPDKAPDWAKDIPEGGKKK